MKYGLILIFFSIFLRAFVLEPYQVSSSDMAPTLLKNDYLWVRKWRYGIRIPGTSFYLWKWNSPKRGEVVLMKSPHPPHPFVFRRVVGLPGDRLFYSHGVLFINEKAYRSSTPYQVKKEWEFLRSVDFIGESQWKSTFIHWQEELDTGPYSILTKKDQNLSFGPYKVPQGYYFVMGDHRSLSQDSRFWPPDKKYAQGYVNIKRKNLNSQDVILIPQNTILKAIVDSYFSVFFMTTQSVKLIENDILIPVRAQRAGLNGNLPQGVRWRLKGSLNSTLKVNNKNPFFGGVDRSVVPFHSFYGQAYRITWSCEKTLPVFTFLCQFNSLREGRLFWPVHKTSAKEIDKK